MMGLECCTLVLELNYGEPGTSLGSVWIFEGDGSDVLESTSQDLESIPGWARIAGPMDYETASAIHSSLQRFLERAGVEVISEGVAD